MITTPSLVAILWTNDSDFKRMSYFFLYSVTSLAAGGAIAQVYCAKNSNGLIKRTQTVVMLNGFN